MDDITIRVLLSRFIKQALQDARTETIDDDQFAEAVASAAWNSLIYLLRQSLVQQDRVTLQEVGEFVKESGNWKFHPAASLAEADAFTLPAANGRKQLARLALFHLDQGIDLARSIPKDVDNPRAPERWRYLPVIEVEAADATLASELRKVAVEIFGLASNLTARKRSDVRLAPQETLAETMEAAPPPASEKFPSDFFEITDVKIDNRPVDYFKEPRRKPDRDALAEASDVTEAAPEVISLDDLVTGE